MADSGIKRNAAKLISVIICIAGLAVMAGWIFNVPVLKSISLSWVSMKFSTAIAFVVSGVTLYFLARAQEGEFEKAQIALSMTSLIIAILMGLMFFSAVFGIQTGIESLFVKDPGDARSVLPGRPSVPTMVNFMLVAVAAIMTILNPARLQPKLRIIGIIIGVLGTLAAAGYIFKVPVLYYYIAGLNSAMALHTALLFMLLGAGIICL
jgi:hypothetical protein